MLDVLFERAEGFSCSLDVLYKGLDICKSQFFIKTILIFSAVNFFQLLVITTLDLDPDRDADLVLVSDSSQK
jgi:hypothetical protein